MLLLLLLFTVEIAAAAFTPKSQYRLTKDNFTSSSIKTECS